MHDVGVPKMEVVLIPEMPMSGDLPRQCYKKISGSPVLGTCEIQEAQHMSFLKRLRFLRNPRTNVRHQGLLEHSSFCSKIKRLSLLQYPPPLSTQCALDPHKWTQLALNRNVDVAADIIHGLTWSADRQLPPMVYM